MQTPLILTNCKTYESAVGENALALAKIHAAVAKQTDSSLAVAVQAVDIFRISSTVDLPVFAQHCDGVGYGAFTGWVLPEALKAAGATGVILNHSEHRFADHAKLKDAATRARQAGLVVCICAENAEEGALIAEVCAPDFVAVEPPELIGGDISVSTARPELIEEAVELIGNTAVLVGAGVKNAEDMRVALKLGAQGVLLASGVTKAADPQAVLMDLVRGMKMLS